MSKQKKLLARLLSKPKDFKWYELTSLLQGLGFELIDDTASSGRKFYNAEKKLIINLHEPHLKKTILVCYLPGIIRKLKEGGFIE